MHTSNTNLFLNGSVSRTRKNEMKKFNIEKEE
jgi:hypothetical protein